MGDGTADVATATILATPAVMRVHMVMAVIRSTTVMEVMAVIRAMVMADIPPITVGITATPTITTVHGSRLARASWE